MDNLRNDKSTLRLNVCKEVVILKSSLIKASLYVEAGNIDYIVIVLIVGVPLFTAKSTK